MCEAGLGSTTQFRRAVAHHSYIDQAVRARDGHASEAEGRVLAIGGNVLGTVSLKLLPAGRGAGGPLRLTRTADADRPGWRTPRATARGHPRGIGRSRG